MDELERELFTLIAMAVNLSWQPNMEWTARDARIRDGVQNFVRRLDERYQARVGRVQQ